MTFLNLLLREKMSKEVAMLLEVRRRMHNTDRACITRSLIIAIKCTYIHIYISSSLAAHVLVMWLSLAICRVCTFAIAEEAQSLFFIFYENSSGNSFLRAVDNTEGTECWDSILLSNFPWLIYSVIDGCMRCCAANCKHNGRAATSVRTLHLFAGRKSSVSAGLPNCQKRKGRPTGRSKWH